MSSEDQKKKVTKERPIFTPQVDIIMQKDAFVIFADMPGVDKDGVDVQLHRNTLSLYGRVEEPDYHGLNFLHSEYGVGNYEASFTLSEDVDMDNIQASMKDGVLKIVLPKSKEKQPRRIEITTGQ